MHRAPQPHCSRAASPSANADSDRKRRCVLDITTLLMSNYEVEPIDGGLRECRVRFHGPKDSPYEGGVWTVSVVLPEQYPYRSPSIGFVNRIFHPNVDERSGSVCLDVINQSWSPMFNLINIFESFLPQLLLYPNASDPLNPRAAAVLLRSPAEFERTARSHTAQHAMPPKGASADATCGSPGSSGGHDAHAGDGDAMMESDGDDDDASDLTESEADDE